jgi:hypothetical protein
MPSTLVHVALGGLLGAALLGEAFDRRTIGFVMGVTALPDLDTLLGLWVPGAHRAVLHTMVWPCVLGAILAWDTVWRPRSALRRRAGDRAVRLAWVTLLAVVFAHILYDGVVNGVNLLWPLADRFYDFSGELLVSTDRGILQTFIELGADGGTIRGTTETTHYYTGVDPSRGAEPKGVERVFHVVQSGERLLLSITGFAVVGYRLLWPDRFHLS